MFQLTHILLLHMLALTSFASTTETTANYDNIPSSDTIITDPNPGTYEYITYTSFALANLSADLTGVAAHTTPNVILTSTLKQATGGTPSLTIAAPYTSFALTDFWFGCSVSTANAVLGAAIQCTITVAAFKSPSDQEVAVASFTFTPPDTSLKVSMIHAVLPSSFTSTGIKNVTIIQNDPTTQALLLDTVSYYLYK